MQQDDALPHYARNVRNILNQMFPNRWIGRSGPVSQEQPTILDDMRTRIKMVCVSIQS